MGYRDRERDRRLRSRKAPCKLYRRKQRIIDLIYDPIFPAEKSNKAALKYFFAFFKYTTSQHAKWTKEETVLALTLYCKIPFGKTHKNHPQVIELAKLLGRTSASVSMKMGNFGRFDEELAKRGISGLAHGSSLDKIVWDEYHLNMQALSESVDKVPYIIMSKSKEELVKHIAELSE